MWGEMINAVSRERRGSAHELEAWNRVVRDRRAAAGSHDMKASAEVLRSNEAIRWKGRTITVDALTVNGQTFVVTGRFIKKAELRRYGAEDIIDPIAVIRS
jgi:hypothetical protein